MADTKITEREYVIPLRREYLKVPQYRRTGKAVKAIKKFIARHMKIADRNVDNVKIDMHFNNEFWMRGRTNPPSRIKVKATKEGDIVKVTFVEEPKRVTFAKARAEIANRPADKKAPAVEKASEKTEEQKKDEVEKEKSTAESKAAEMKQEVNVEKHTTKSEKASRPQRMALQK
jgi:large subunit ribosomal protein L31e